MAHLLVAICVGIVVYPFARGILDNLVVSSILVIIGLVVWFGSESEVKASLNSSVRSVLSSFDFDKLLALVFDVLEKERNFFTDIFGSDSMRPLLKFAAMLAVRSLGF